MICSSELQGDDCAGSHNRLLFFPASANRQCLTWEKESPGPTASGCAWAGGWASGSPSPPSLSHPKMERGCAPCSRGQSFAVPWDLVPEVLASLWSWEAAGEQPTHPVQDVLLIVHPTAHPRSIRGSRRCVVGSSFFVFLCGWTFEEFSQPKRI